jgi:hypothetical protein
VADNSYIHTYPTGELIQRTLDRGIAWFNRHELRSDLEGSDPTVDHNDWQQVAPYWLSLKNYMDRDLVDPVDQLRDRLMQTHALYENKDFSRLFPRRGTSGILDEAFAIAMRVGREGRRPTTHEIDVMRDAHEVVRRLCMPDETGSGVAPLGISLLATALEECSCTVADIREKLRLETEKVGVVNGNSPAGTDIRSVDLPSHWVDVLVNVVVGNASHHLRGGKRQIELTVEDQGRPGLLRLTIVAQGEFKERSEEFDAERQRRLTPGGLEELKESRPAGVDITWHESPSDGWFATVVTVDGSRGNR